MRKRIYILIAISLLPAAFVLVLILTTREDSHNLVEDKHYARALEYVNEAEKLIRKSRRLEAFALLEEARHNLNKAVEELEKIADYYHSRGKEIDYEVTWAKLLLELHRSLEPIHICPPQNARMPASQEQKKVQKVQEYFVVSKIMRGDGIIVNKHTLKISPRSDIPSFEVRLIGVDTPEPGHPNKLLRRFGEAAKEFMRQQTEGCPVLLEYDQVRKDKHGRTLAYVHVIDSFNKSGDILHVRDTHVLNEEIIRWGYGRVDTELPFKYMEKYKKLEKAAKDAGRGQWAWEKEESRTPAAHTAPREAIPTELPDPVFVYVNFNGSNYHRGDCQYLKKSKIRITLEDAQEQAYSPCPHCKPPE